MLLIQTCHKRGALAMGGMAAQIPIKNDEEANNQALARVKADKEREAGDGAGSGALRDKLGGRGEEARQKQARRSERLEVVREELAGLREEAAALRGRWQTERDRFAEIKRLSEQIEHTKAEAARAQQAGDLERASQLTYGTLRELEDARQAAREQLREAQAGGSFLRELVTDEEEISFISTCSRSGLACEPYMW